MKVIKFFSIFLILFCQPVFTYSILIDISEQRLYLKKNDSTVIKSYSISSSFLGEGQVENSFKTPLGNHIIVKKIGENADIGTIFKERVNTGRIASIIKEKKDIADDVITSRIMCRGLIMGTTKEVMLTHLIVSFISMAQQKRD